MPSLFIVDDDYDILLSLEAWFTKEKYKVKTFENGKNIIENIQQELPDIVLLDVSLKGEDGRQICQAIKETVSYPIKVLQLSANPAVLLSYQYNFAAGIVNKPFDLDDLVNKCNKLLPHKRKWYE